ncbi:hypothetical protein RB653_002097 [Dictyostelium firmibasis]|uniref:threonine--tRNA ligase n=1 Tax=Dictyostelium firmibasis TaxID=79012 RepID=A0AAN7YMQ7_9MYCE
MSFLKLTKSIKRINFNQQINSINNKKYFSTIKTTSNVKLNDGRIMEFEDKQTPLTIANKINKTIGKQSILSRLNGNKLISMKDNIEMNGTDFSIEFLNFEEHPDARICFWNSSSLILARATLEHFKNENKEVKLMNFGHLVNAQTADNINQGTFYVDIFFEDKNQSIKESDINKIKKIMEYIVKRNDQFEHIIENNESIIKFGKEFKVIDKFLTIESSNSIVSLDLIKNSSVVGPSKEYSELQRIIGISFPTKDQMNNWIELQKIAALRDHRVIGKDQELFFFHPFSPGSCFFLPHGTKIYNKLLQFLRSEYRKRGYQEVISPNIYNQKLWETSGHWDNYKDNMFSFECDHTQYSLKPMNCPGHCLMYGHRARSHKELPMRIADFGVLHRNETHGSLSGLTRVRRFQQDDAHIFCTPDMIREEIKQCLDFMKYVYTIFNFTFHLELSTRPDSYLGELSVWEKAEQSLSHVLTEFCGDQWRINPGDGAFYGPKIDIHLKDANGKNHQCATIQLDFQLPIRFNLEYSGGSTSTSNEINSINRPVMIHRALFGSVERMMAILMEHTAGKWPFWLSPRQCIVIPVSNKFNQFAQEIQSKINLQGYDVDVDLNDSKLLPKKIREATISQYNYIIVVGQEEVDTNILNIRKRDSPEDNKQIKLSLDNLLSEFKLNIEQFK